MSYQQKKTKEFSEINIDFSELKNNLKNQFDDLLTIASKTDISFIGAVKAQEKKQLDGINNLEKKLLSAQKKKFSEKISKMTGSIVLKISSCSTKAISKSN